jgi:hypothetical protein
MAKPPEIGSEGPQGVRDSEAIWVDDRDHAETLAALEEFRRTGVSYSIDEAVAELDRLIAVRRTMRV